MTRDDILNMSAGREMRDLIATEVMKWEWDDGGRGFRSGWDKPDGSWVDFDDWRPDEDISAAWEVHKKICNPETYASSKVMCYYGYLQQSLVVRYGGGSPVYPYVLGFIEPIDISRAALLAV